MDSIPYYIQRLYGKESSVLFHLNQNNNDFLTIEKALNEYGITYDVHEIKSKIISRLEENDTTDLVKEYNKYGKEYKDVEEIVSEIRKNNYRIEFPEFKLLMEELQENGHRLGMVVISQKYNQQKKNDIHYFSTGDIDHETTPIFSFHHTYYENEYILSNILTLYNSEKSYYTSVRGLHEMNYSWKGRIQ
tara:strand:- start:192 stop:761 length:570 start_codon:yes stop_codon:yes gene_type:complete